METKVCRTCERDLPVEENFPKQMYKGRSYTFRYKADCSDCHNTKQAARARDRYASSEENRRYHKNKGLQRKYNITLEEFEKMYQEQGGLCLICEENEATHVDHDHACCPEKELTCGKCIRGILCSDCNTGIGLLRDNPDRLISAAAYLMRSTVPIRK